MFTYKRMFFLKLTTPNGVFERGFESETLYKVWLLVISRAGAPLNVRIAEAWSEMIAEWEN